MAKVVQVSPPDVLIWRASFSLESGDTFVLQFDLKSEILVGDVVRADERGGCECVRMCIKSVELPTDEEIEQLGEEDPGGPFSL